MKYEIEINITSLTEQEFLDIMYEARTLCGIQSGDKIPTAILDYEHKLVYLLFDSKKVYKEINT
jgi:hypothetical protein